MDMTELVGMSRKYGSNPELVLAGGGNTSAKDENTLYVKCSGTQLATINEDGFVPVDRHKLAETMTRNYPADDTGREAAFLADMMSARTIPGESRRPSVEALLHSLFPQKYVLHLHPSMVNGLTCAAEGEAAVKNLFKETVIWIPATRPGYILGKLCNKAMSDYRVKFGKDVQIVFLQNHGIFVAADTVPEMDRIFEGAMNTIGTGITEYPDLTPAAPADPEIRERILKETGADYVQFCGFAELLKYTGSEAAAVPLLKSFTPDHIVYCGAYPMFIERVEELRNKELKSRIVLLKNSGFYAVGQTEKEAENAAELFTDALKIAVYAKSFGGPLHMSEELTDFILHWEAESYRKSRVKKEQP